MKRIMLASALVAGLGIGIAAPLTAGAGQPSPPTQIDITYQVAGGANPVAVAGALTPELFASTGDVAANCIGSLFSATVRLRCDDTDLTPGESYTIGVDGLDSAYEVQSVTCTNDPVIPEERFDTTEFPAAVIPYANSDDRWECNVFIQALPVLYIDKVINGGTATVADFEIEIYDDTGTQVSIDPAIFDPDAAQCSFEFSPQGQATASDSIIDNTICAEVPLPEGSYTIGEVLPDYGYDAASLVCVSEFTFAFEILPSPAFDLAHSSDDRDDTLCTLTNDYLTQTVSADIEVTNDGGGTATGADFTIEVFDNTGVVVASGVDPEPGTGNASAEFVLPIGDYTFGVDGPEGYDASAAVAIVPIVVSDTEIIGTGADFSLDRTQTATGVIGVDDQAVATTTTTTTTTVAPTTTTTTVAPTTAAPTTAAPTTQLPATGSNGSTSWTLLIALAFVALGGGAILTTRRS